MGNRRIYMLIFLLVVSVILLISSTYAWFSLNREVESTGVQVRIGTAPTLDISADAKTWRTSLTLLDILEADYEVPRFNQLPIKFQPVSSGGFVNDGKLDLFFGIVSQDVDTSSETFGYKRLRATKEEDKDGELGRYLAFDLYFKSVGAKKLYLGKNSYVTYKDDVSYGVENALRIAFVKMGTIDGGSIKDIQSLSTSDKNDVYIWEPNYDSHTDAAVLAAKELYNLDISNDDNVKIPYYGINNVIEKPVLIDSTDANYFNLVDNIVYTDINYKDEKGENVLLFEVESGITKVRVYAWVEGQDVDCENEASGSSFEFNINFTNNAT